MPSRFEPLQGPIHRSEEKVGQYDGIDHEASSRAKRGCPELAIPEQGDRADVLDVLPFRLRAKIVVYAALVSSWAP
jgi:hypothetical protein